MTKIFSQRQANNTFGQTNKAATTPTARDVPADGNCLFSALAVSLAIVYADNAEVQRKLQWTVKLEELSGDLSKKIEFFAAPAARLREQAADFLYKNINDEKVKLSVLGGAMEYNAVMNKKLDDAIIATIVLQNDVDQLECWKKIAPKRNHEDLDEQLEEKRRQIAIKQAPVKFKRQSSTDDEDLNAYIRASRKKGFYCGGAQVIALSKYYKVPITVILNYGKENAQPILFNSKASGKPLVIGHVNDNHFISIS